MKRKLIIIQTVAPDYRANFYEEIFDKLHGSFELYAGKDYFEKSVKTDPSINKIKLRNFYLLNRKFLFQTGLWHLLFKNHTIVLEMNPRIISNWIFLFIRYILNKETVLWGHAWPRNGRKSKTDSIRNLMRVLAKKIVVYTKTQRKELLEKMPEKEVLSASNSVVNSSQMGFLNEKSNVNLIYVGRLTNLKKSLFMVKAFEQGIHQFPKETKLIIVGSGEEKKAIEQYIQDNNLSKKIELKGHINDYNLLKKLYAEAFFSISPGYVGLSITQSFGFGVPMLVSRNENHSPEIEAFIENENGLYFNTDDMKDFTSTLNLAFENKSKWDKKKKTIVEFCKQNYSANSMAQVFINLVAN